MDAVWKLQDNASNREDVKKYDILMEFLSKLIDKDLSNPSFSLESSIFSSYFGIDLEMRGETEWQWQNGLKSIILLLGTRVGKTGYVVASKIMSKVCMI